MALCYICSEKCCFELKIIHFNTFLIHVVNESCCMCVLQSTPVKNHYCHVALDLRFKRPLCVSFINKGLPYRNLEAFHVSLRGSDFRTPGSAALPAWRGIEEFKQRQGEASNKYGSLPQDEAMNLFKGCAWHSRELASITREFFIQAWMKMKLSNFRHNKHDQSSNCSKTTSWKTWHSRELASCQEVVLLHFELWLCLLCTIETQF